MTHLKVKTITSCFVRLGRSVCHPEGGTRAGTLDVSSEGSAEEDIWI